MRKVEVCIVGGGIAGLSAARHLCVDSLLIDRKSDIGLPVRCGEGMSIAALQREEIPLLDDFIARRLNSIDRFFPGGVKIGTRHKNPNAVILHKDKFEKYLMSQSNVEIQLSTELSTIEATNDGWRLATNSGIVFAKYVIAADGPASKLRRLLGEPLRLSSASSYAIHGTPKTSVSDCGLYFGNTVAPGGYAWIFSKGASQFNVGVISHRHINTRKWLDLFLYDKFTNYRKIAPRNGYLPQGGWDRTLFHRNIFFVGDAGGFVDPLFSGGISLALLSGRLAAEAINSNAPDSYAEVARNFPFRLSDLIHAADFFYQLPDDSLEKFAKFWKAPGGDSFEYEFFTRIWGAAKNIVW